MKNLLTSRRRLATSFGLALAPSAVIVAQPTIITPQDWAGFDATGTHDNAGIFQQMGAQVPATGGLISLPTGLIATSAACPIPSLTTVTGQGDSTEIICLPAFPAWSATAARAAFINRAWQTGGGETGIVICNLRLTGPVGATWSDAHFIEMVGVTRVRVDRVTSTGWGNCTAMTRCQNTEVSNCVAELVSNCAYDHWGGTGWVRVTNTFAAVAAGPRGSFGIMVTGLHTDGSPGVSARAVITGNQIEAVGGHSPTLLGSCIEINAGDDTGNALVRDIIISDNICSIVNGCTHRGIHLAQAVQAAQVRGNVLRGGVFAPAVTATGPSWSVGARDCIVAENTVSDWSVDSSQVAPLAWWGVDSTIINNRGRRVSRPFVNPGCHHSNVLSGNVAA